MGRLFGITHILYHLAPQEKRFFRAAAIFFRGRSSRPRGVSSVFHKKDRPSHARVNNLTMEGLGPRKYTVPPRTAARRLPGRISTVWYGWERSAVSW